MSMGRIDDCINYPFFKSNKMAALAQDFGCVVGRKYRASDTRALQHGLMPDAASGRVSAMDFFTNAAARTGWGTPSVAESADYQLVRLSYNYWLLVTLHRNHWITRRIVETPAKDMVRAWPKISSDLPPDDMARIDKAIQKTRTKSQILTTLKWARLFGGAGALMVIDGHEDRLEEPLDLKTIEPGAYKGLIPFERWTGIQPSPEVSTDISKPREFNLPEYYFVQGSGGSEIFKVHTSRILRFCGPDVPAPEYQAQCYWGISVIEPVYESIRMRDNLTWNILALTFRASIIAMREKALSQMLAGGSMNAQALQLFQQRMQMMNQMLSNQNMLILPEDGGLEQINYTFSGVSDVYQQFQLDTSGAAEIPVTRLFGRTITGLGQSNDADERLYEERIAMDQEDSLRPQYEALYPVICMSELGEVPDDLALKFPSVRVLSEEEKSKIATEFTTNVTSVVDAGLMNKPQAMKEIKQYSDLTGFGSNITAEDIEEAEEDEKMGITEPLGEEIRKAEVRAGNQPDEPEEEDLDAQAGKDSERIENLEQHFGRASDSKVVETREHAGIPIAIEYRAGTRRMLKNPKGNVVYDRFLENDYGFIVGTLGRDGDEIDVITGPIKNPRMVYVVSMIDLGPDVDKRSDEDKVMLGFADAKSARTAFIKMYPPEFLGGMSEVPLDQFREQMQATV